VVVFFIIFFYYYYYLNQSCGWWLLRWVCGGGGGLLIELCLWSVFMVVVGCPKPLLWAIVIGCGDGVGFIFVGCH